MRRRLALTLVALAAPAMPAGVASAAKLTPYVSVSVVTKDGTLIGPSAVRPAEVRVKIGGKRCTVAAGTPLAALVALQARVKRAPKVGKIALKDYGTCGKRPSLSSRLYLTGIGADKATGPDGWIYEVNGKGGSTSAADPAGPFGRGRIKKESTVNWRWCRASEDPEGDCGDALAIGTVKSELLKGTGDGTVGPIAAPVDTGTRDRERFTVPVQLRSGANGDTNGTSVPAPVGTLVDLITPGTGVKLATGTVGAGGSAVLEADASIPPDAFFVARGAAGVAPAGKLLTFPKS